MNNETRELVREAVREAMLEGGKLALDSAIRITGRLVQQFTVSGHPQEAAGASGAMEMLKQLRDHSPELYEAHGADAAPMPPKEK